MAHPLLVADEHAEAEEEEAGIHKHEKTKGSYRDISDIKTSRPLIWYVSDVIYHLLGYYEAQCLEDKLHQTQATIYPKAWCKGQSQWGCSHNLFSSKAMTHQQVCLVGMVFMRKEK